MEILSRQLIRAEKVGSLTGIKISRYAPTLSHLFYADDAFLCCKATPLSFETLRDIFKDFEAFSGQMINFSKSYIKFSPNTPADFREHLTSILKMAQLPTFGTYLGVPIDIPRKRSAVFLPFVDTLTTRISSWSALHLSQPSKLIVISAILLASLNHVFSAVPIPIGVCRKIDALLTAFWWRNDWNRHSIHSTSKSILQAPKEYGGLGFKNTHLLSQALLLKNFWRIHTQPTAFLARYMAPKYARDLPVPLATSRVSQPSFIWSGICKAVSAANNGICWKLGNGRLIDLWSSRWINEDGSYSVKSGYSLLWSESSAARCIRSFVHTFPWKQVWRKEIPPKISIMLWRLAHNIMPTNDNLISKYVPVDSMCTLCHSSPETEEHLFRSCEAAQHVWNASALGINAIANPSISFISWVGDFLSYLHRQSLVPNQRWILLHFCCVLQAIWSTRNAVIFRNHNGDPAVTCRLIENLLHSHVQFSKVRPTQLHPSNDFVAPCVVTSASLPQRSAVSFSVSTRHVPRTNCFSYCIISTELDYSKSSVVRASSSFDASTRALLGAMRYAHSLGLSSVCFFVSCCKLSAVLATSLPVPISVRHSFREIRALFVIYPYWSVRLATG
ncbi:uncharacterized protein LOC141655297 [Silene latifolia]|uniref:uncharacterized protein LOC141655297 n=1 Tax=Silene latifolia TaxID=37657 RepID=UPI003D7735B3